MAALVNILMAPVNMALTATRETSPARDGANCANTPIWLPSEPMLANPHRAYVAITRDRGDKLAYAALCWRAS